jgi:hypothetical protein
MANYKAISTTYDLALRTGSNVTFPKILNSGNPKVVNGYVQRNTEMLGSNLVTLVTNVVNSNGVVIGKIGDQWLEVTSVGGQPCSGFVAHRNMGVAMSILTEVLPPVTNIEITSVMVTPKYSDGTIGGVTEYFPAV